MGFRSGGLFVLETFSVEASARRAWAAPREGELAARFRGGFHILRDEVVEDVADWGTTTKLVRFVAQKK